MSNKSTIDLLGEGLFDADQPINGQMLPLNKLFTFCNHTNFEVRPSTLRQYKDGNEVLLQSICKDCGDFLGYSRAPKGQEPVIN